MSVKGELFGKLENGNEVIKYTITNKNGMSVSVMDYGATITNINVPDKNGSYADVIVSFDNLEGFEKLTDFQGVVVGPYANRIGNAEFTIDEEKYKLTANEKGVTCLHSAGEFNTALWDGEVTSDNSVAFYYVSPDGMNGFPGNTEVRVEYTLTEFNELKLEYYAVSDKKTVINLTNHSYFNLAGAGNGTILNHTLKINADNFTPVDELSITTGAIRKVSDTPFDFRKEKTIGDNIDDKCEQLEFTGGFDHNFCINDYDKTLKLAAEATDPESGRCLSVYTDLPGIQFYAGNFLKGVHGKNDLPMVKRGGFCLETQYYPDTPNKPEFPQCTFEAGEVFTSETVFAFSIKK